MNVANGDVPKSIDDACCCCCVGELIRMKLKPFSMLPAAALAYVVWAELPGTCFFLGFGSFRGGDCFSFNGVFTPEMENDCD